MIIASFWTIPLALFSLLFAYVSHHICLVAAAASPLYPFLTSWLTDYYNNSCRFRFCDNHDARAMLLVLEFFFYFFFDQGIASRSAAWASRVDVV